MDFNNSFIKIALEDTNLLQNEINLTRKYLIVPSNTSSLYFAD